MKKFALRLVFGTVSLLCMQQRAVFLSLCTHQFSGVKSGSCVLPQNYLPDSFMNDVGLYGADSTCKYAIQGYIALMLGLFSFCIARR